MWKWWGEIYLAITVIAGLVAFFRGSMMPLRGAVIALIEAVVFNGLYMRGIWQPLVNLGVDVLMLIPVVSLLMVTRSPMFVIFSLVFVLRILNHAVWSTGEIGDLLYAQVNNLLFAFLPGTVLVMSLRYRETSNG